MRPDTFFPGSADEYLQMPDNGEYSVISSLAPSLSEAETCAPDLDLEARCAGLEEVAYGLERVAGSVWAKIMQLELSNKQERHYYKT
eukprot:1263693-Rhodomonas_salina.1